MLLGTPIGLGSIGQHGPRVLLMPYLYFKPLGTGLTQKAICDMGDSVYSANLEENQR